ncbi:MAG TPA: AbrB/MazE/SpoVT family DNA-binding domain-containing protein [Planctomycetota bacterium]|nr:AbrB/MazE/SpoVT family DNA-binding domain-containing protein [Planctomycetota bacterium]HRR81065.1 AbrB/MazE/SpoVT family DNA-binding domain-containing protein [Planctomycetota bacterium]HRT96531.1 AbrB/MazE/SpoVT family DNA-binding domain-containing protein [Planctomycetota bacterium]
MAAARLSTKGQLVIPKVIRDRLGVHPGDRVDFVVQDNGDIVIRPATVDVRELEGMLYRPGRRPVSIEEMNEAIRTMGGRLKR